VDRDANVAKPSRSLRLRLQPVNQRAFEKRVLEIWVRSRVPLTRAHVQHLTGASRKDVERWLDAMTVAGMLDADVDDSGEMRYAVRGAERPRSGLETVAELERMERLSNEVAGATTSLATVARAAALTRRGGDEKSVIASGALSLFLGPLGWLYAAPLREAVPAILAHAAAVTFIPHFLLVPVLGVLAPLSGAAGVYYAWRHNQTGERTGLFSDKKP
jgi:hypothetical protein